MDQSAKPPTQAWVVTFAGMTVNLCLGILYAWSVWKANLVADASHPAGSPMTGLNAGWHYLTDAQATWAYAACGFIFALTMIPGGRLQDRHGPRVGASLGGFCLASGCLLAGWSQSYLGLLLGFGVLGGIGMGFGYSAATPAAVRWFESATARARGGTGRRRLRRRGDLHFSTRQNAHRELWHFRQFLDPRRVLRVGGLARGFLVEAAAAGLSSADAGPPRRPSVGSSAQEWEPLEMLRTWQYFALFLMFAGSAQAGLLVIANAAPMLNKTAGSLPFFAANAWILASFGGFLNATGRIGTGHYSDWIGRSNAYLLNGVVAAGCLFLMPHVIDSGSVALLFLVVGVAYWQFGGTLALMPAITADFFGPKYFGLNYGFIYLGWGVAFFVPQIAGYIKDYTGSLNINFYISGVVLVCVLILSRFVTRPTYPEAIEN